MEIKINRRSVLTSMIWKFLEYGGTQGTQFIIQIVLARLLLPEHYGLIALVMVFITLGNVFIQSGFNNALVQKKVIDDADYSSVFYLSLIVSTICYLVLFFVAPFVADFYHESEMTQVIRILSVTLIIGSITLVQNAYIARNMEFKKLFFSSFGAVIISGVCGITAAYLGLGVWAIVIQQIVNRTLVTLMLWFAIDWRPKLIFSISRVKELFDYGWKLLASSMLNSLFLEIRTLIIGRLYSSAMLGYYNRGNQFPKLIVFNIDGALQSVLLPTLSAYQDDMERVKQMVKRTISISAYCVLPLMMGLAVTAEPMVKVLLTDKWLPAVPFLQILVVYYAFIPIHNTNLQAIKALGRSDIFLKLEIIKKLLEVVILAITIPFGIYVLAIGGVFAGIITSYMNAYPNKKLLNYHYLEQIRDILPSIVLSLAMGLLVYPIIYLDWKPLYILLTQVLVGGSTYLGLSIVFKVDAYYFLLETVKGLRGKVPSES